MTQHIITSIRYLLTLSSSIWGFSAACYVYGPPANQIKSRSLIWFKRQCSCVICIETRCSLGLDVFHCDAFVEIHEKRPGCYIIPSALWGGSVRADRIQRPQLASIFMHACVYNFEIEEHASQSVSSPSSQPPAQLGLLTRACRGNLFCVACCTLGLADEIILDTVVPFSASGAVK